MTPALDAGVVQAAKDRVSELNRLESRGWELGDGLTRVQLRVSWSGEGRRRLDDLASIMELITSAEISTQTGFRLGLAGDNLEVLSSPLALSDYYSGSQVTVAERIRDGDSGAAGDLEADWSATVAVDLARGLFDDAETVRWRIVRAYRVVLDAIEKLAWWELGSLVSSQSPLLILVVGDGPRRLVTGSLACCSENRLDPLDLEDGLIDKRKELAIARGDEPHKLVLPEDVIPRSPHEGVSDLVNLLRGRAAAAAWAWLSNAIAIADGSAELEFFGLQRVKAKLPPEGPHSTEAQVEALRLYRWATSDVSVDRILAVRQVVSIYARSSFLNSADDVRRAAELVYVALRRDAVSEALANTREARQIGLSATRAALEGSLASAKSVGERVLASLGALGALMITAATSENLSDSLAAAIALGIGAFSFFLAIWNVFVEGPILGFALRNLREDISNASVLMSDEEVGTLADSTSVRKARKRVLTVRILAPTIYTAVALLAMIVAYPHPEGFWDLVGFL